MDFSINVVEITGKKLNFYISPYTEIHTTCTRNLSVKKMKVKYLQKYMYGTCEKTS